MACNDTGQGSLGGHSESNHNHKLLMALSTKMGPFCPKSQRLCGNLCLLNWFRHPSCSPHLHPMNSNLCETFFLTNGLQVQLQVINGVYHPPAPQFGHSKDESGQTLILPLSCYDKCYLQWWITSVWHMQHLCYTLSLKSHNNPMRLMGQVCPSRLRVDGPLASALGFLNCHFFGSATWKGDSLEIWCARNTLLWVDLGVAWGTDSCPWGPPDLHYHVI